MGAPSNIHRLPILGGTELLHPKKKVTKRQMKEDALISTYVKATKWYEDHKRQVSMGLTALIVVVIAALIYANNQASNNEKAMTELGKVFGYFDAGQYQVALEGIPERNIPGLKSIVENYGGSRSGELARFYLATVYYTLGRYDEALEQFDAFDPPKGVLEVSRLSGIAACYEAKGQYDRAAEYFERAAVRYPQDLSAAENLSHAGRNHGFAGNRNKAVELFKKLKKDYPTSVQARDADRYIAQFSV